MKRAQNSDFKTHVKSKIWPKIRRKSLYYLFLETPCMCRSCKNAGKQICFSKPSVNRRLVTRLSEKSESENCCLRVFSYVDQFLIKRLWLDKLTINNKTSDLVSSDNLVDKDQRRYQYPGLQSAGMMKCLEVLFWREVYHLTSPDDPVAQPIVASCACDRPIGGELWVHVG